MVKAPTFFYLAILFIAISAPSTMALAVDCQSNTRLNLPNNEKMTLYSKPFLSWQSCQVDPDSCLDSDKNPYAVSWPNNQACVEPLKDQSGQKIVVEKEVDDPYYGRKVKKRFYQVNVSYSVDKVEKVKDSKGKLTSVKNTYKNDAVAWVDEDYLFLDGATDDDDTESSGQDCNTGYTKNQRNELSDLIGQYTQDTNVKSSTASKESKPETKKEPPKPILEPQSGSPVDQVAKSLSQVVGKCAIVPPLTSIPQSWKDNSIYDQAVLKRGQLKNLSASQESAINSQLSNGRKISRDDLINIDVVARSIYGEMANCFDKGLQYPMAIAKVALNRSDFIDEHVKSCEPKNSEGPRINDPFGVFATRGDEGRPTLSRVLTAKDQFSVWNPTYSGKVNHSLDQVLCPPSGIGNDGYWKRTKAGGIVQIPNFEKKIWEQTLKIATEAVLFRESFQQKTKNVSEFFYTSGIPSFMGLSRVTKSVSGKKISNGNCVNLFSTNGEKTEAGRNIAFARENGPKCSGR